MLFHRLFIIRRHLTTRTTMILNFLTLAGCKTTMDVRLSEYVYEVKQKYFRLRGIPADQVKLVYRGRVLDDNKFLWDYGVEEGEVAHVIFKLRGGARTWRTLPKTHR